MATLFIHPNDLKTTSYIDENVDDKILVPAMIAAQDIYIHTAIGTGLFNELKTQIEASTLTALNTTLLTYIKPALIYHTLYELVEPMAFKFTNKNIVKKKSENSDPVEYKELVILKDKFKNIGEWHTERLKLYLIENQSSYPLFYNPGTGVDTIHANRQSYSCGWFLGEQIQNVPDYIKAEFPGTYGTE